jgi:quinol monooxygenase YgiN
MYGLIVKLAAQPGKRDAVISILLGCVTGMPGCLSYVVAKDVADEDAIWATEVWDCEASHDASFSLPAIREAVAQARLQLVGMQSKVVTEPVGGCGLPRDAIAQ